MSDPATWAPTARLRWVERHQLADGTPLPERHVVRVLQQYWAEALPGYMRNSAAGEWRDVEMVITE